MSCSSLAVLCALSFVLVTVRLARSLFVDELFFESRDFVFCDRVFGSHVVLAAFVLGCFGRLMTEVALESFQLIIAVAQLFSEVNARGKREKRNERDHQHFQYGVHPGATHLVFHRFVSILLTQS